VLEYFTLSTLEICYFEQGTMFTPAIRTPLSRSNTDADFASTPIRKEKQKIRKDDIIRACRGTTKVSKDDWIEWLRRLVTIATMDVDNLIYSI